MQFPIYFVDTFTSVPFKGNPTAVCILPQSLEDKLMHSIAQELNLPVSAFIHLNESEGIHSLRYFTVTGEIPACGHATLAAAAIIFSTNRIKTTSFKTIEDIRLKADIAEDIIFLTYPRFEAQSYKVAEPTLESLGLKAYESVFYCKELETLFIEISDPDMLMRIKPDFKNLMESDANLKEVVLTSQSSQVEIDFLLRSFCPWIGIDEDPVTGSVHSVLAGFWGDKLHKKSLLAYQASERGGSVYLKVLENQVQIGGKTKVILEGTLNI